jgi:predicted SnoaL-like aldol condensation-catalyzing enzyme
MLAAHLSAAIALLALPLATLAAPRSSKLLPRGESYCPGFDVDEEERLEIFDAMNELLFSAANNDDPSAVETAFASFYSPDLIEHTAASDSYASDVSFLTALLPGTSVELVGGMSGCFTNTKGQPICTIHYKATPKGEDSLIPAVTAISDYYRYDGSCIVEHWDTTYVAGETTTNANFPGPA